MKPCPSIERVRELVSYDTETGQFINLVKRGPLAVGAALGGLNVEGYVQLMVCGYMFLGHRLAWYLHTGGLPKHTIDHINGIKNDNRIANLRDVSYRVNNQNIKKPFVKTASGVLGAYLQAGRYRSMIRVDGKQVHLGRFDTADEAHHAYIAAKRQYHEGNTL